MKSSKSMQFNPARAGYNGPDPMRDNAIKIFGGELKVPEEVRSFSSPDRTKMRLFKKGGHATHEQKRAVLHREQEHELSDVKKLIEKEKKLKRGGIVPGGSLTNEHFPKKKFASPLNTMKGHTMKRGKHSHHGMHHHAHGGHHKMEIYNVGGHADRYARGGAVYEHEMVGEHTSHSMPHSNYEAEMRGEHCIEHAGGHHVDRHHHQHEVLSGLRHGGRAHHHGHRIRRAAGGVAKMRHGQADSHGHQIAPRGGSKMRIY